MTVSANRCGYYRKAQLTARTRYLQIFEGGEYTESDKPLPGFDPYIAVDQDGETLYSFRPEMGE